MNALRRDRKVLRAVDEEDVDEEEVQDVRGVQVQDAGHPHSGIWACRPEV